MLTVAKLIEATKGLDADARVIVGIINGPRFDALDAFEEAAAAGLHLYILCAEDPRDWEGPPPTSTEGGTATLKYDPGNPEPPCLDEGGHP
ncbi:MAG TPA: hypothetical protein PKE29_01460 [Phycisphaerales bacterium]|nr:hypothetical protein [Phycisphaerales bacterium]